MVSLPFPAMVLCNATDNSGDIATSFRGTLESGDGMIDEICQPDSSPRHLFKAKVASSKTESDSTFTKAALQFAHIG